MAEFNKGFEPLPEGDYLVRMNRCNTKPCNNGKMVDASFQVVNGDYKDRLIFDSFLVEHTSEAAEKIGKQRLDKYLQAIGVEGGIEALGEDFTQLEQHTEIPFTASLKIEGEKTYKDRKTGEEKTSKPRNKVKSFKKR